MRSENVDPQSRRLGRIRCAPDGGVCRSCRRGRGVDPADAARGGRRGAAPPDEMAAETASEDDRAREAWEEQAAGGSGTEPNTTEAQVEAVEEGPSDALPVIEPA